MNEAEYTATMNLLANLSRTLLQLPLDDAMRTVAYAESAGPVLDPTGYRDGMENLRDQRRLLEAAVGLRDAAAEIAGQNGEGRG